MEYIAAILFTVSILWISKAIENAKQYPDDYED